MLRRDPQDPRRRERLAASYLASLLLHALLAALLFSLASSSSEEGAGESISGGTLVTLEQRAPVVAQVAVPAQQAPPVPNVPHVAPLVRHAPLVQPKTRPQPPQPHELATFAPTAPPNPTPVPQASAQPNPVPTTRVYETRPQNEIPAVPTVMPSVAVQQVAIKPPPTAAPSPVPTAEPTARATPEPAATKAPSTPKPATPAPSARPTAVPTTLAASVARATTQPSASPAPLNRPSLTPARNAGVPSPSPTQGPRIAQSKGISATPAPKGESSPGPRAGNGGNAKIARPGPVHVPPTPQPRPKPTRKPESENSQGSGGYHQDLSKLLGANNPVAPAQYHFASKPALDASMVPTPPPAVVAMTRYTYEQRGAGDDALVKMWVTGTHRDGPTLVCEGWMLRYPHANGPTAGGANLLSFGGVPGGVLPPIVEEHASVPCSERALVPFAGPSTPSP
ncbi:MAG TPA: hypothetical protein VMF11_06965 [Candidatus Baltobacteraceae bacterium]|nr:hypothetical protein [Candidatus Baltobacteraceae bacterium]